MTNRDTTNGHAPPIGDTNTDRGDTPREPSRRREDMHTPAMRLAESYAEPLIHRTEMAERLPVSRSSKIGFNLETELLDAPHLRRRVATLLRGWSGNQSNNTIRCRHFDLHQFAAFVLEEDLPSPAKRDNTRSAIVMLALLRLQPGHVAASEFVEWLKGRCYAHETIVRRVKTLRLWAHYLYERRMVPRNIDEFPTPRAPTFKITGNEASPLATPVENADTEHLPPEAQARAQRFLETRNRTIVDLLTHSSLDHTQLRGLDWGAVDLGKSSALDDDDTIIPPARVQVPRRDGRSYWRHLAPHATRTLRRWSRVYASRFGATLPDRPVAPTLGGDRLSQSRLYEITND